MLFDRLRGLQRLPSMSSGKEREQHRNQYPDILLFLRLHKFFNRFDRI